MKPKKDQPTQAWLKALDAISAWQETPAANDDDLLHLARQLTTTLAPLRTINQATEQHRQRSLGRLRARQPQPSRKRRALAPSLLLAAVLLVVLVSSAWGVSLWNAARTALNAATSLQQVQGVSLAQLARAHPGLHPLPLLPIALPDDTKSAAYGVVTDAHDPTLLRGFVVDYRIDGQDVSLYEQPASFPLISSQARPIAIGSLEGQLFVDPTGDHALQWFQDNMQCQLTSTLPVERLVALAEQFQPIKDWDMLR